jgi:RNA polymerase sigma-70 factor (ECF subfamily)
MDAADLMGRYCDGDERAFRELYDRFAPRLLGYLHALTRDRAGAEDALQQTFVKLHAMRASYVRGANPLPWIYTIAHRTLIDEARRTRRAPIRVLAGDEALPEVPVDASGVQDAARSPEPVDPKLHEALMSALDRLPESYRAALLLTKYQGLSCADAASVLGTSTPALKLRVHRAYMKLRELLRDPDEDPPPVDSVRAAPSVRAPSVRMV